MENKKKFFKKFFSNLEKNKIDYVILRNSAFLENKENFGEIDVLIKSKNFRKLKKIIKENPFCYITGETIDLTHPLLVLIKGKDFICFLDFQIKGIGYCGAPILKEEFLLNNKRKKRGYFILNNEAYLLMLFIHNFIFKREKNYFKKYEKEFYILFTKDNKEKVKKELNVLFGQKNSEKIVKELSKRNFKELNSMKRILILYHLSKNPLDIFKIIYSKGIRFMNYFNLWTLFYFLNPFKIAPLISFVGTDGSGKSTLANKLKEELDKMQIKSRILSAGVFSRIKFMKKRKKEYSEKVSSLGKKSASSNLEIFTRIIMQILNQLKILYLRKKGILVITDRYVYDLITLFGVFGNWKKIIKKIFQKPTKIFYINASLKSIKKRNQELSSEKIKEVQTSFEKNSKFLELYEIKNETLSKSIQEVLNENWKILKNEK